MSISGSLEDVSVADVMQFIHLGRRTGTLLLDRGKDSAMIGFHKGRLVSARAPSTPKLGDLLVDSGILDRGVLNEAVEAQASGEDKRSIGQILVAGGALEEESLRQVVSQQIEETISELVGWVQGTFEFAVDDLRPVDEIALFPGDVVPGTDINTQMVLLEAARIFDERNRDQGLGGAGSEGDPLDDTNPVLQLPEDTGPPESQVMPPEDDFELVEEPAHPLHVVSSDRTLLAALEEAAPLELDGVLEMALDSAGRSSDENVQPLVLVDLRDGQNDLSDIARLHREHPSTPVLTLVDRVVKISEVYAAGALAALPAEVSAITACLVNVLQSQQQLNRATQRPPASVAAPGTGPAPSGAGVARLRRVYGDLRSGLLSATVALNLMHIISESVERAVLFLVRHDSLQALGAFGMGSNGRPLAELTRGMRLELAEPSVLVHTLQSGEAESVAFDEAVLPEKLKGLLGSPLTGQVVIFPVLGAQRVISVIYTDNGQVDRPIEDIEILELATAQVGMAFENELLRRQISQSE
ncbi:MAG: DUF4388 domain-containing protein [Acidobacteriota bacterium]